MPGAERPKRIRPKGPPWRAMALATRRTPTRPPQPIAPKPAPAQPTADQPVAAERPRPVDGEGRPFITLAQFLKLHTLAESGGQAKALVRDGGITVNGEPEDRPGRKLHARDVVVAAGQRLIVDIQG